MTSRFVQLKEDLVTLSKLSNDVFNILDNQTLHFLLRTFPDVTEDDSCVENIYSMVIFEDILDFSALMIKGLLRVRRDLKKQQQSIRSGGNDSHKLKRLFPHPGNECHEQENTVLPFEHLPFDGDEEIICVQPKEYPAPEDLSTKSIPEKPQSEETVIPPQTNERLVADESAIQTTTGKHNVDEAEQGMFRLSVQGRLEDSREDSTPLRRHGPSIHGKLVAKRNSGVQDITKAGPMHESNDDKPCSLDEPCLSVEEPEEFCCGDCGKVFSHHGSLIRHTYSSHSTQISSFYKCKSCRKMFSTLEQYKDHDCSLQLKGRSEESGMSQLMMPPRATRSPTEGSNGRMEALIAGSHEGSSNSISCEGTGFVSNNFETRTDGSGVSSFSEDTIRAFPTSEESITQSRRAYACRKCERIFPTLDELKIHSCKIEVGQNHVAIKSEPLSYTGKMEFLPSLATMTDSGGGDGQQTNSRARGRLCKLCGGYFATYSALIDHRHIHIREYPFQCGSCEKAYKTAGELKRHQHVHTGERPYGCDFCGRYFALSHHLKRHVQTHLES